MSEREAVDQRDAIQSLLDMIPLALAHVSIGLARAPMSVEEVGDWLEDAAEGFESADLASPFFGKAAGKALREYAAVYRRAQSSGSPPDLRIVTDAEGHD